jgi:hypothetical protein
MVTYQEIAMVALMLRENYQKSQELPNRTIHVKVVIQSEIRVGTLLKGREESIAKRRSRALEISLLSVSKI